MIEWTHNRNKTVTWLLPLCISIICFVKPVMDIIVNQTLTVGEIMLLIVSLCSLGVSVFAIWRTKKHQHLPNKAKKQVITELSKEKIPALNIVAFGFLLIIIGTCIGVILGNSNLYALLFSLIIFAIGIAVFIFGIAKMGSNKKPPLD